MLKSRFFRPDFIVAILAVVIGLCTMFVYIYQANIMSKQMHASVWPYLQPNFTDGKEGILIRVNNKGVGPAIVKKAYVVLDGNERYADSKKNLDSLAFKLTGNKQLLSGYTNLKDRVISAGEVIDFIEITDSASLIMFKKAMSEHSFNIEICYCSVYGDCWTTIGTKNWPCDKCE